MMFCYSTAKKIHAGLLVPSPTWRNFCQAFGEQAQKWKGKTKMAVTLKLKKIEQF